MIEFSDFLTREFQKAADTQVEDLVDPRRSFESYAWTCGFYQSLRNISAEMVPVRDHFLQTATTSVSAEAFVEFLQKRMESLRNEQFEHLAHCASTDHARHYHIGRYEGVGYALTFLRSALERWEEKKI